MLAPHQSKPFLTSSPMLGCDSASLLRHGLLHLILVAGRVGRIPFAESIPEFPRNATSFLRSDRPAVHRHTLVSWMVGFAFRKSLEVFQLDGSDCLVLLAYFSLLKESSWFGPSYRLKLISCFIVSNKRTLLGESLIDLCDASYSLEFNGLV
mgnify:CR=1 FL=1